MEEKMEAKFKERDIIKIDADGPVAEVIRVIEGHGNFYYDLDRFGRLHERHLTIVCKAENREG